MTLERSGPAGNLAAVEGAALAGDARAVPELLRRLRSGDALTRRTAAMTLGRTGSVQAVPGLLEALRDEDSRVRCAAIQALGRIGDLRAVPGLQAALDDPDREVRRIAARALKRFGGAGSLSHDPDAGQFGGDRARRSDSRGLLLGVLLAVVVTLALLAYRLWHRPLGPQLVVEEPVADSTGEEPASAPEGEAALPAATPAGAPQCGGPPVMYLLIVGSDTLTGDYESGFADVIRIVRLDFVAPSATVLSIPRDLWVRIPGLEQYGIVENRVKTAYAYGNAYNFPGEGVSLLVQTLAQNFGTQVDHYVIINFDAFVAGVDAIGGIDIVIPEPVDGSWQDLPYFPAGHYHMDGETTLQYARIREDNTTDLYRIDRQTQVILAIRERMLSPQILPTLPRLVDSMKGASQTDLSPSQISSLLCIGQKIEPDAIQTVKMDYSMTTSTINAWDFEVLLPDYEAITRFVQDFNAGAVP
jgi:LCP family protein required for cell wall assembly